MRKMRLSDQMRKQKSLHFLKFLSFFYSSFDALSKGSRKSVWFFLSCCKMSFFIIHSTIKIFNNLSAFLHIFFGGMFRHRTRRHCLLRHQRAFNNDGVFVDVHVEILVIAILTQKLVIRSRNPLRQRSEHFHLWRVVELVLEKKKKKIESCIINAAVAEDDTVRVLCCSGGLGFPNKEFYW